MFSHQYVLFYWQKTRCNTLLFSLCDDSVGDPSGTSLEFPWRRLCMTIRQQAPSRHLLDRPYLIPVLNTVVAGPFVVTSQTLTLQTDPAPHFLDLTPIVTA